MSVLLITKEGKKKTHRAFNNNKHPDNCVVLSELHFLVHLPGGIPAALPRANKTTQSTSARLDAIITFSLLLCSKWLKLKWEDGNAEQVFFCFCIVGPALVVSIRLNQCIEHDAAQFWRLH